MALNFCLPFIQLVVLERRRCLNHKRKNNRIRFIQHYVAACVVSTWNSLPEPCSIPDWLVTNLEKQGFQRANVVQQKAIPVIFSGKDLVLVAPTGSGKTLAFLIPLLSLVDFKKSWIQALILVPTPELGFQIHRLAKYLCSSLPSSYYHPNARSKDESVISFLSDRESSRLRKWKEKQPVILISTLDGALEYLSGSCLDRVEYVVLDEFDDYFIRSSWRSKILGLLPSHSRQVVFSSATLQQSQHFLHQCRQQKWTRKDCLEYIHIDKNEWLPKLVHYYYVLKEKDNRIEIFVNIWRQQKLKKAIVFIHEDTKLMHTARLLQEEWKKQTSAREKMISLFCLSSNASLKSRQNAIAMFCNNDASLLLISGHLMRGLDIPEVTQVYNLEWADGVEEYVHRAGRSARWLREGLVLSFVRDKELFAVERVSNQLNVPFVEWPLSL